MKQTEMYLPSPRPLTGVLVPVGRTCTPSRCVKDSSSKSKRSVLPEYKSILNSPYLLNQRPQVKAKSLNRKARIKTYAPKSLYSWNCVTKDNKFLVIRPCVIIKPSLSESVQLFGLCDGKDRESVSLISAHFCDLIEQVQNIDLTPRNSLYLAYDQTIKELGKSNSVLVPHEISIVLIKSCRILTLVKGNSAVVVGRKTFRGWNAELINGNADKKLECGHKIIVICNSGIMKVLSAEEIVSIASKYWEMRNPNIASWEIAEKAKIVDCPICLVIYLAP